MNRPVTGEIRVLCVDDDEGVLSVTTELLEMEGDIEAVPETEPATALQRLESEQFDCVVSDYDMPRTDGLELLAAVRRQNEEIPFILFTGKGSEEIASEAISAGVTEYLQKGSGTDQYAVLANRIEQAARRRQTERRLAVEQARRDGLFRDHPEAVVETVLRDGEPIVRETNEAFDRRFGQPEQGVPVDEVVRPATGDPGVPPEELNSRAAAGETIKERVRRQTTDGVRDFLVTVIPLSPPAGPERAYAVYTDVTERERRKRRIDALARETDALLEAQSRRQAADAAVETVAEQFGLETSGVYVAREDRLEPLAVTEAAADRVEIRSDSAVGRAASACFASTEPASIPASATGWLARGVVWPLGDHGVLVTASDRTVQETAESLVEIVAANLTTVFDRIDREGVVTTLQGAAREIGACETVQAACDRTVAAAEEVLELTFSAVALYEDGELVVRTLSEEFQSLDRRLSVQGTLAGKTYRAGERFVVDDTHQDPAAAPSEEMFRSAVSVPIGRHGVFQAVSEEFGGFDEQDADRIELLIAHTARTLDRLRETPGGTTRLDPAEPD